MNLSRRTKQELIDIIQQLETENQELRRDNEQIDQIQFSWTGNLGRWYWDIKSNSVTFNPLKVIALGYDLTELPERITYQFFTEKLHPDDYTKTMDAMREHLSGKRPVYECEYRIKSKIGDYKWFYDRGRVTRFDSHNNPLFVAGIVFDITEQKRVESELKATNLELKRLTLTDPLTGLANLRSLYQHLEKLREEHVSFALGMLDLDNFKQVNDMLGHQDGDQVLVDVADILKNSCGEADLCGRYGGEEFLLIMPKLGYEEAMKRAELIRIRIETAFKEHPIRVTVSIGIVTAKQESIQRLLTLVDEQLYLAKARGKNQVVGIE